MQQYNVTGMSCAACSARVEKAVNAVSGVTACSVSLLTSSMGVEGTADSSAIINAVKSAGYGASLKGAEKTSSDEEALRDRETPVLKRRLFASLGFLAVLMYVSMGHGMWGWRVPEFLDGNYIALALTELLLAAVVMVINQRFFINGFKGLLHGAANMDTLVALGSSASFIYSVYALYAMTAAGDGAAQYMHELYFESAAMILTLITVGKLLEAKSKGRTTDALKGLMSIAPKSANVIRDGAELTVGIGEVKKGDIFLVRPGESVPVDGVVIEGESAVDESALTGESIPVDKSAGDSVSAATMNRSGFLRCEASRVGEDTTLSQIIKMVSDAAATKAPIAKVADKVSGIFVPTVIAIALLTIIIWLLIGRSFGFALARGISVLVISCPCALGLATPVAIMVGSGVGAKQGILFKTAAALESTGKIAVAALDKTGTITEGRPTVTDIIPTEELCEDELLTLAAALENGSEHPLAKAITEAALKRRIVIAPCSCFRELPGKGLSAFVDGKAALAGSFNYISSAVSIPESFIKKVDELSGEGKTPLLFAKGGRLCGLIALADTIKPDSRQAVQELKSMGLRVVMLTGDNRRTAEAIGRQAGVDEVIAGVLPGDKEAEIKKLSKLGAVAMVGDGINDAPALTRADIGIAIGAGADIAVDAADVVLMNSKLSDVPAAIRLSRATLRNIHQNLFWAFFYNSIGIPLAAGAFVGLGLTLNPMFGAAAMSLSSFCVVSNALRLNLLDVHSTKHDKKIKPRQNNKQEEKTMTKTMKITGMMCPHCEANVKKALEAIEGVENAEVSHVSGTAVVTISGNVTDEQLFSTVTDKGYTVNSIE